MSDYKALCERLRGYTPRTWTDLAQAADAIESLQKQLEIALADLKQCQDMWSARTKAALQQ
jgi:hypothetical protein